MSLKSIKARKAEMGSLNNHKKRQLMYKELQLKYSREIKAKGSQMFYLKMS